MIDWSDLHEVLKPRARAKRVAAMNKLLNEKRPFLRVVLVNDKGRVCGHIPVLGFVKPCYFTEASKVDGMFLVGSNDRCVDENNLTKVSIYGLSGDGVTIGDIEVRGSGRKIA